MENLQVEIVTLPGQQHWTEAFPLVYQWKISQGNRKDFSEWLERNRSLLLDEMSRHGAILIRNAPVMDPQDFDRVVQTFRLNNFAYRNSLSNAVRKNITERVFTANEAPAEVAIYLHHEMAQTPYYPSKLFFFCEQAAESGGETPLCRSDILLTGLEREIPDFVKQCRELGIRYTNVMPADNDAASGQGRSWQSTLRVAGKSEAESRLKELGYSWQWLSGDDLKVTTRALPAVRTLKDGREVFFNQIIAAWRGWQDKRNDANRSITYGNGSSLAADHLETLLALSDSLTFNLPWKTGDVALVDNFLVMHGRNPFSGRRRVLASLVS